MVLKSMSSLLFWASLRSVHTEGNFKILSGKYFYQDHYYASKGEKHCPRLANFIGLTFIAAHFMELQPADFLIYCQTRVLVTFSQHSTAEVAFQQFAWIPSRVCVRERFGTHPKLLSWDAGVTCLSCRRNGENGVEAEARSHSQSLNCLCFCSHAHGMASWPVCTQACRWSRLLIIFQRVENVLVRHAWSVGSRSGLEIAPKTRGLRASL